MTVREMMEVLSELPPDMPVASRRYVDKGAASAVGDVVVEVQQMRRACPDTIESFCGAVHWFVLGSDAAVWNEQRGGTLESVAVVIPH